MRDAAAVLLALCSSLMVGGAAVLGGVSSRKTSPIVAMAFAQGLSVVYVVPLALAESNWEWRDFNIGLAIGVATIGSLGFSFLAVQQAHIGAVNAIAGGVGATTPAVYHAIVDRSVAAWVLVGVILACVAVGLVAITPREQDPDHDGIPIITKHAVVLSVLSGLAFGAILIGFSYTTGRTHLVTTMGARLPLFAFLLVPYLFTKGIPKLELPIWALVVSPAIVFTVSDMILVAANHSGANATAVATIVSMNPAWAALFSWLFVKERLGVPQMAGLGVALMSIAAVTLG
ncbi:MAG: EamA family transporter [Acidimicrobiia bacterium]